MADDTPTPVIKHDSYFWDMVVFSVENTLFKVPRFHFQKNSEVFRDCFSLPQGNLQREGDSEENPFKLEGIEKADFVHLLEVLYPLDISHAGENNQPADATYKSRWISILKLSTLYRMLELRRIAIKRLETVITNDSDPVARISLSRLYKIPQWFETGCCALVNRAEGISPSEAEQLDYRTAYYIYRCRESRRGISSFGPVSTLSALTLIRTTFDDEVKELKIAYCEYGNESPEYIQHVVDTQASAESLLQPGLPPQVPQEINDWAFDSSESSLQYGSSSPSYAGRGSRGKRGRRPVL